MDDKLLKDAKKYIDMFRGHWYDNIGEWFTIGGLALAILVFVATVFALPLALAFLVIRFALSL